MLIFSFILFLVFAAICAYLAERWVLNTIPGDLIVPVVVGIIGAQLGDDLIGHFGPNVDGISLMPCLIGSMGLISLVSLLPKGLYRKKRKPEAGYYIVGDF